MKAVDATGLLARKMEDALIHLADRLEPSGVDWVLEGGAGRLLRGFGNQTRDLDVMIPATGIPKMETALADFVVEPVHKTFRSQGVFTSHYGTYEVEGVHIDMIADMLIERDGWRFDEFVTPELLCRCHPVSVRGRRVLVTPLESSLLAYWVMGREETWRSILEHIKGRIGRPDRGGLDLDWLAARAVACGLPVEALGDLVRFETLSQAFYRQQPI